MALYVLSLGGSLIVPEEINYSFLKKFKEFIQKRIQKKDKFIIVAGGGKTARKYQNAANKIVKLDDSEKDWIGIHSTRLNAHLIKTIFKSNSYFKVIKEFENELDQINFKEDILVAAGWKPGFSTDFVAVTLANKFKAKAVLNLSNIDYVYDKDPNKFEDAKKYENIPWTEFRKIVGDKWSPGMSAPFDPIASKLAHESKLEVAIINGKDLDNLEEYFEGKKFKGTTIK